MVLKENVLVKVSLDNELKSLRAIDFAINSFEKTEAITVKRYVDYEDHYYLVSIHNPEFGLFISELDKHKVVFIVISFDDYYEALSTVKEEGFNEVNAFF